MITTAQVDAEQGLASLCGVLNASYARLVTIVAQALVDQSWAIAGVRSPEHWLTIKAGLSPFRAKAVVTVARRAGELPTVMGQFADGQLSFDQVAVVARYAPAQVEASMAEFAVNASVPQLRRSLSQYSFDPPAEPGHEQGSTTREPWVDDTVDDTADEVDDTADDTESGDAALADTRVRETGTGDNTSGETKPAGDPPTWNGYALEQDRSGAPGELSMSYDQWGRFSLRFSAPADLGALVEAAIKEAKDALFNAGQPEVTHADALVEMARRSIGAVNSINRRDAYRTYVHLDTEGGWLTGRPRLPQHIADKLTCDGIAQPIWHTQGAPVNVGRAQRIVPTRTRRLVQDRDRGCRFPGCTSTRTECHHLIHWADGGPTDTFNLAELCPYHHDGHHSGHFTITGNANDPAGLTFTTPTGLPIRPGPTFTTSTPPSGAPDSLDSPRSGSTPPTQPGSAGPPPPTPPYRGPTGEGFDPSWLTFHESRVPALI